MPGAGQSPSHQPRLRRRTMALIELLGLAPDPRRLLGRRTVGRDERRGGGVDVDGRSKLLRHAEPASATGDAIVMKPLSRAGNHAFLSTQLISAELCGSTITCCCADVGGYE